MFGQAQQAGSAPAASGRRPLEVPRTNFARPEMKTLPCPPQHAGSINAKCLAKFSQSTWKAAVDPPETSDHPVCVFAGG